MQNNMELQGEMIKKIFEHAKQIAVLHAVLTSPRGDYFRLRLLQAARKGLTTDQLREMRKEANLGEQARHVSKLSDFKLIAQDNNKKTYVRTPQGEFALNAIKEFEIRVGKKEAEKVFEASLGTNSIQLFLTVYGHKKHIESHPFLDKIRKPKRLVVKYRPSEIGRMVGLLSRTIDSIAAIDKLDDSGILKYEDDGYVHFSTIKARSFYQYLKRLYDLLEDKI